MKGRTIPVDFLRWCSHICTMLTYGQCENCCLLTDLHLSGPLTPTPQRGAMSQTRNLVATIWAVSSSIRLRLSPSRAFFICCCFLQPAKPLIQSSLCCCCLSCVSFFCILSSGGSRWEAGDDSCISSRSWGHVGSAPLRHYRVCEPRPRRGRNRGCTEWKIVIEQTFMGSICMCILLAMPLHAIIRKQSSQHIDLHLCCVPG